MASTVGTILSAPRELLIILACEFADSFSTFALDYVFVLFLSSVFSFSDQGAGWLYGIFGLMVLLYGVVVGPLIDNIGVKWALIVGSTFATIGRLSIVFVSEAALLLAILLTVLPIGVAMTSNVLKLGVRRYTTKAYRSLAFDSSYFAINCAALGSAVLLTGTRALAAHYGQYYRLYLLLSFSCCLVQLILSCCLREIVVHEETNDVREFCIQSSHPFEILHSVCKSSSVWKFFFVSLLVCAGVGTCLRHFGSTFPKTFTRVHGANAPFELVLSVNPVLIMVLMPLVSLSRFNQYASPYELLVIGSTISALSMFVMGVSASTAAAVISIAAFTVGEMIWAPRFLEMSVMVGDEGREGTVVALTGFPKFIARLVAGGSSGYLLQRYCPQQGICQSGGMVWSVVGFLARKTWPESTSQGLSAKPTLL
ncbi:transporter, major facilitator family protein [Besnoitia besnoiti]|uniref:Transporter, major facilitator family protein n=1 Tax=Besnoitia besnoiti TaxID=94643 RepID=A0A2A9MN24_BESBE|nr:transporter, major facilitator family protein [Besnoitia besnoiti]PFH37002.1 transporter, major facilitator family protein [Besnoitia besnoiti]